MKRRTIKPDFFTDTKTGRLSITSQMLFIGMWCLADREGYIEYDIDFIKIQIFPYQKIDIKNNIDELLQNNLIISCKFNEKMLLHILNFKKHQPIHPHEASSQYPSIQNENVIKCNYNVIACNDKGLHPNYKGKGKDNSKGKEGVIGGEKNFEEENKKEKKLYGEFKNVLLTDDEYKKLSDIYFDKLEEAIEFLSSSIKSKGYKYDSHYAVMGKTKWVYKSIIIDKKTEDKKFNDLIDNL